MEPNFSTSALYAMDNLDMMQGMDSETVHLIYADPPFNSKRIYQGMPGTKAAGHKFRDTWSWNDAKQEWLDKFDNDYPAIANLIKVARDGHSDGMAGYLAFMAVRVIEMQRVLRPDGSLYLHCDPTASAYLRTLLDIVFGARQFRNEIVWCYTGPGSPAMRQFNRKHDTIFWYAKGKEWIFNKDDVRLPYKDPNQRPRKAFDTGDAFSDESVAAMRSRGKVPETWWVDIAVAVRSRRENTGWSTQKPLALLERIIKASSNPGDIVFDPFCGCGTALVAAEQLGRRWVGADDDANAIDVIRERIANLAGTITDAPQLQHGVRVIDDDPPTRTKAPTETVYRDPTGHIVPVMPSDKMTNAQIRDQLLEWQKEQDGRITCPGCVERLLPRHFQNDHVTPKSDGGVNRIDNRILLCGPCNLEKSNNLTMSGLWRVQGLRGKDRQRAQGLLAEVQHKARALVATLDTGAPVQGVL